MASPRRRSVPDAESTYISLASSPAMRRPAMFDFIVEEGTATQISPDLISFAMAAPSKLHRMDSISRLTNLQEIRSHALIGNSKALVDWNQYRVDEEKMKGMNRKMRSFYEKQNELIDRYTEIDRLLDSKLPHNVLQVYGDDNLQRRRLDVPAHIDEESVPFLGYDPDQDSVVGYAVMFNFVLNVLLLAGKAAVAILSNSLSLIASLVDSALDFLSTAIIWTTATFIQSQSWQLRNAFPVGRSRLEPLGVLVFSIIMIVSFIQVAIEAIQRLYQGATTVDIGLSSVVIMILTIFSKLVAWLWCRSINSSSVRALAQDALTDVIFNTFSIVFPLIAHFGRLWWVDPLGAIALSLYVIISWAETSLEHIQHLTGTSVNPIDRQVIMYLCMRFADCINQVSALNAYYVGDKANVEVDVLVSEKMTLRDSHDVGEALQYALETLPIVERAFVHLDYREDNFAGHLPR
ncbi:cation efflux family-domain-containing protein [Lipomyces kononenkoae]|uniref:Cation efflux family-domain-containing protein n=1 Tax=Lipomyces kononenkoae TaxID=34357 RepID=A0ACC3T7G4_LIPKO